MDEPTARSRSPLGFTAIVIAAAATLLLVAGVIYAFAYADARVVDGTERFRLLAQAATPFVAALAVAAVAFVVHDRRGDASAPSLAAVAAAAALGLGSAVALVAGLLAVNGIVVDLTRGGAGAMFRLSNVLGRLATVGLAGFAIWLGATAPAARETRAPAAPPPSPPGDADPASRP